MKVTVETPSKAFLDNVSPQEMELLTKELTYTNTAISHEIKRMGNNVYFKRKNPDAWKAKMEELRSQQKRTLIFQEDGRFFLRPGSLPYIKSVTLEITSKVFYPVPKPMPWAKELPFTLYEYQVMSWRNLLTVRHGNVELCTGAGKSAIILSLVRNTGFRCAIVVPSRSIFLEQLESLEHHLGKANVGAFGDGKKKLGKRITICIGDSLANIKKGSEEDKFFSGLEMLVVDESHQWGAESLEEVCFGVLADIPYRFFLSGTQTRGDGGEKLLQAIIGATVYELPTWKAVEGGFICDHDVTIIDIESSNPNFFSNDPLEMKRGHFINNKNIAQIAAKIANAKASHLGEQTLILVQDLIQISMLSKLLTVPFVYAHSESNKIRLAELGLEKVKPAESVEKFNKNEAKVLIGTSCISTGTNIYPTHSVINWVGGQSEIATKQGAVGRAVRKHKANKFHANCKEKLISNIYDFNVRDIEMLEKHLAKRVVFYKDSFAPNTEPKIKRIQLNVQAKTPGRL